MKHCTGCCQQGREACPTPQACEVPDRDDMPGLLPTLFALAAGFVVLVALLSVLP